MPDQQRLLEIIDRFSSTSVALVGDLVLDRFILGTPKRISREAPVIILHHEGQRDIPGGAANALANMAALGLDVIALGAIGDDEPGAALRRALADRGVATDSLVVVPGYRTPTKVRILGGGASSLKHQVARYDIEDELPDDGDWYDRASRGIARDRRMCRCRDLGLRIRLVSNPISLTLCAESSDATPGSASTRATGSATSSASTVQPPTSRSSRSPSDGGFAATTRWPEPPPNCVRTSMHGFSSPPVEIAE